MKSPLTGDLHWLFGCLARPVDIDRVAVDNRQAACRYGKVLLPASGAMNPILDLLPILLFLFALGLERFIGARTYPKIPWWWLKGGTLFVLGGVVSVAIAALIQHFLR